MEASTFQEFSDDPQTMVGGLWDNEETTCGGTRACDDDDALGGGSGFEARPARTQGFFLTRMKTGECFEVLGDAFFVGKSREASYQLRGTDTISRRHACFHVAGDECWIEDNESLNGTFVNETRLMPHCRVRLESGMRIRLSDEDFLLETRSL